MRVSEAMTREVRVANPTQTIRDVAKIMAEIDAGAVPVGENDRLVGMITDRDIAVRGVALGYGPDTPVSELMSTGVISAHADEHVEDAARKMGEAQVRRLPVIDERERLVGMVSLGDLARETDGGAAEQALEGVSAPGDQHRQ